MEGGAELLLFRPLSDAPNVALGAIATYTSEGLRVVAAGHDCDQVAAAEMKSSN